MGSVGVLGSLTFLTMGIFAMRRSWQAVRQIAFAMGGAVALDTIVKWIMRRPRSDEVYAHTMPASYSFPSGHALYSLTFYISIAIVMNRHTQGNRTKTILERGSADLSRWSNSFRPQQPILSNQKDATYQAASWALNIYCH